MENLYFDIDINNIPRHIAIIMDGNGRWAKSKMMPRTFGHKAGVETIKKIVKESDRLGVKYMTVYAFSTENWKRPEEEVSALMGLLVSFLRKELEEMNKNNIKILAIGDITKLPKAAYDELTSSIDKTKNNTGLVLSLALNYGGRNDILTAVKSISDKIKNGKLLIEDVDESVFSKSLSTHNSPDPDFVIRTSGEQRLSNFLLWEVAYSEFYYTDVHWPDFDEKELHKAIYTYQKRDRRFGGIK